MKKDRKILVIANNCFSLSNSNGRTLGNLFQGWPKENLAQMCVIAKEPLWDLCDNYYCIEDNSILHAFLQRRKAEGRILKRYKEKDIFSPMIDTKRRQIGKKTLPKFIIREIAWAWDRWRSKAFEQWIDEFYPNMVVLQFGDSSFMIDIALYIAQSRNIPLVVYNTEGYYFFDKFWYHPSVVDWVLFPFYKRYYDQKVRKLMKYASSSVYLNEELKEDYDDAFKKPSTVIYNSSCLKRFTTPLFKGRSIRISYLGGLGHGRDSALRDVGEVIHSIDPCCHIDVYGPGEETIVRQLKQAVGVEYHGVVSYETVQKVMSESDLLFHVEPTTGCNDQLRYAFSGKIADSIMSGKCFVLYAPKDLACSKYIIDNQCAWFAETKDDLHDVLLRIFNNEKERIEILHRAKEIAEMNHNYERNAKRFQSILINESVKKLI